MKGRFSSPNSPSNPRTHHQQRFPIPSQGPVPTGFHRGQRLSLLAYDVVDSREEVKIVLSGVSPLVANVLCSSSALEENGRGEEGLGRVDVEVLWVNGG